MHCKKQIGIQRKKRWKKEYHGEIGMLLHLEKFT